MYSNHIETLDTLIESFTPNWRDTQREAQDSAQWECDAREQQSKAWIETPLTEALADSDFGSQIIHAATGSGKTYAAIR